MLILSGIYLILMSLGLMAFMLYQHHKGTTSLLSLRNMAILGFIIYQSASAGRSLLTQDFQPYAIAEPAWAGFNYVIWSTVFVIFSLWIYQKGWLATAMARRMPLPRQIPSQFALSVLAILLLALAAGLRFGVPVPLLANITNRWGLGFAAMAAGISGWLWAGRLWNPLASLFALFVTGTAGLLVLPGGFGRRELVAVGAAFIFGLFYGHWRLLRTGPLIGRLALFALVPILVVGTYTSARSAGEHDRTLAQHIQAMASGDSLGGVEELFSGQMCGRTSLWILEEYPETREYRHVMALKYFFLFPIPREWWPDKPNPTSTLIAQQANFEYVNVDKLTMGPGIIGQARAEGGWYALFLYALMGAVALRFLDELITLNVENPLVVIGVSCALGQVIGLPRGELSAFAFALAMALIGAYGFVCAVGLLLRATAPAALPVSTFADREYAADEFESDLPAGDFEVDYS